MVVFIRHFFPREVAEREHEGSVCIEGKNKGMRECMLGSGALYCVRFAQECMYVLRDWISFQQDCMFYTRPVGISGFVACLCVTADDWLVASTMSPRQFDNGNAMHYGAVISGAPLSTLQVHAIGKFVKQVLHLTLSS